MSIPRSILTIATVMVVLGSAEPAAHAAPKTPCKGFFHASTGTWSCGFGATSTSFIPYTIKSKNTVGITDFTTWYSNNPSSGYVGKYNGLPVVVTTALVYQGILMQPGPSASGSDSIVTWTATMAGTYKFSGSYYCLDEYPTGVQSLIYDNGTNITTTAYQGGSGLLLGAGANLSTLTPGASESFSFKLTVLSGEVISFGHNNYGTYDNDTTGLKIAVKQVAP